MGTNRSEKEGQKAGSLSDGFFDRLRADGYKRIIYGRDLYFSIAVVIFAIFVEFVMAIQIVSDSFIQSGTNLAISLTAFILAALSILVSFSDKKFLGLLKELEIYNNLIFNFEFSVYLALIASVVGIIVQSYAGLLRSIDVFNLSYFIFVFFFVYMVLAAANIVSQLVSIGERKARISILED